MKKKLCLIIGLIVGANVFSQNMDRTIMTISNENVSVDDFLSIYNKNRKVGEELDPKKIDEYVELFINFKLKVKEAESLGMDTVPSFLNELSGYRRQLATPYLVDSNAGDQLVLEAYNRLKSEVRASHILVSVSLDASPSDTLIAYNKINNLRNEVLAGADFSSIARLNSQDPSAKENGGDLGFFTALYMVYPFENAAYNTPVGEISQIIRSRFGYHFLKVTDKRPTKGEIKTAHIMVKYSSPAGKANEQERLDAKKKIDDIYNKIIVEGLDFSEMANQYSDDRSNAAQGGILPWFGANKMVESFENAAFNLKEIGAVSVPVETPYGWHIIKLVDQKTLRSFEEEKAEIKKKVEKDSRAQLKRTLLINRLKQEYNFNVDKKALDFIKNIVTSDFIAGNWDLKNHSKDLDNTIFSIENVVYTQADFAAYLIKYVRTLKNKNINSSILVDDAFAKWSDEMIIDYEDSNLENKYNDFRLLMQEYRDGILLYELTDSKIWTKAMVDTIGLNTFYEANKQDYVWDTRVKAYVINCLDENIANKVKSKLSKPGIDIAKVQLKINKKSSLNMDVREGVFLKGENSFVDQVDWIPGVSDLIFDNQNIKIVYIEDVLSPQIKELKEAKGLITSDYQNFLENEWLMELKGKYPVQINHYVLDLVKNNRLNELDEIEKEKSIPVFKGHFNIAFKNAINTLGSSKEIFFEWYGNIYTTELK